MNSNDETSDDSPGKTNGQQPTNGSSLHYVARDVQTVRNARQKLKIKDVEIGVMKTPDVALNAITTKSEAHRIACVIELLVRVSGLKDVNSVLDRIPTVKHKHERPRVSRVSNASIQGANRSRHADSANADQ